MRVLESQVVDLAKDPGHEGSLARSTTVVCEESQAGSLRHGQIAEILDEYLRSLDGPVPVSADELIERHPEYADELREYLSGLELLHDSAIGFSGEIAGTSPVGNDDRAERLLGDYELIEEIGRGGMGVVFRARQRSLDREVALKVLPFAAVLDRNQIARFQSEARAAALVHHPNIVPVHAIGEVRGVHYYAMHLVTGKGLDQTIGLSIQDIATIGRDAALALHAAHEHGIVHRDVKLSNLLFDHESKLWVTDFGLARMQSNVSITKTRDVIGTIGYMSPEQAKGRNVDVDHRTDIYSLGATLYELLVGRPVIDAEDPSQILQRIDDDPVRPRILKPEIPQDLESVILKSLQRNKEARYETAVDLADDLQRFLDGIPTLAKPATVLDHAARWLRRHQRFVLMLTGFLAVLVGVLGVATVIVMRESGKTKTAYREARRSEIIAQENYRDARTAVDHFGSQVAQRLAAVSGAASIRDSILTDTLAYYERFVERSANDPSLNHDTAVTLTKIADLRKRSGQTTEAIAAYREAAELLCQSGQRSESWMRCQNNLALLLANSRQTAEAKKIYDELLGEVSFQLANESPLHVGSLRHVYNNAGMLAEQQDDFQLAMQHYRSALRLADDPGHWRERAATLNNMGMLAAKQDLRHDAIQFASDAVGLYDRHASETTDIMTQHDHAIAETNLGLMQSRFDQYRDAAQSFERALLIQQRVVDQLPGIADLTSALASMHSNHGAVCLELKQLRNARNAFTKAINLQAKALRLAPGTERFADLLRQHEAALEAMND